MQGLKALIPYIIYKNGDFRMLYVGEDGERHAIEAVENKGKLVCTG